ncbi:contractile injection system protein, VgrG/Pvc8 family [Spartinivicinus poritis]|uniref:Contractile injection system protein, VgrG/Pvc8 family n=1 Tax=Spartinivicinus poritis TaxID=2994640 RepID=A0ABT5UH39_9GAMM|nr:contractile injection system protein, VgrG/Pvc8 family [Spartinivicinus sp. A2-2]MDE1465525.1 contractile injection system protein, VgrG/Pvc8 family [Spartinivicinus sp. A2-2]
MTKTKFKILANQKNITQLIADRLIKLTIQDEAGTKSDAVTIDLDNRDQAIHFPKTGAELEVWLQGIYKGLYVVDELEESLDDDNLTIHGKAANMKGSIKATHDASYDNITLQELANQVANKHGYQLAINPELASIQFEHIDQRGESDLNLLTRLANQHNAIAKAMANKLYIVPKGESRNIRNQKLPTITINDPHNSSGRVVINERNDYQAVQAYWFSEKKQQKIAVLAGQDEPKYTLRETYKTASDAKSAASSRLNRLKRGKKSLSLTRPLSPEIAPEQRITLVNHKTSANGDWVVKTVEHSLGGGFAETNLELVLPR